MTSGGRSDTGICSTSGATGSGVPSTLTTASFVRRSVPAGARIRPTRLPKMSRYSDTGKSGSIVGTSARERYGAYEGWTRKSMITGVGEGTSNAMS